MRYKVTVPVYVEWDEIEVIVDHDKDPASNDDALSEIYEKAIQIAIRERPLVPWLVEERSVIYERIGDISNLIQRIED